MVMGGDVRKIRVALGVLMGLALLSSGAPVPAWAAEADEPGWRAVFTPYLWAAGITGDVMVRGVSAAPDASFLDILDKTR